MKRLAVILIFIAFLIFPKQIFAHSEKVQEVGHYKVDISHSPLSPFVGEKVTVSFYIEDENGSPAADLKGTILIKETNVNKYVGQDSKIENKVLHKENATTDTSGSVAVEYEFKKEGLYDFEFVWGKDAERESAGVEIQARNQHRFFFRKKLKKGFGFLWELQLSV